MPEVTTTKPANSAGFLMSIQDALDTRQPREAARLGHLYAEAAPNLAEAADRRRELRCMGVDLLAVVPGDLDAVARQLWDAFVREKYLTWAEIRDAVPKGDVRKALTTLARRKLVIALDSTEWAVA